jgi:hypothetical protein
LFNLSRLSVGWLRLGIAIERIKPIGYNGLTHRSNLDVFHFTRNSAQQSILLTGI